MVRTETAIGIDIGGTNLRAARISNTGEILERTSEKITRDPEKVIERVISLIQKLDKPTVVAIGIGVPGRVDAQHRTVLSGGYLNFAGHKFAERIEAATGKTVTIDNDCNMALVAEIAVGAGQRRENVVMFTIGTGIGGAVVLEGKIVRGRMSAGQLGHLTVDVHGDLCACGRYGCIETTSSGTAFGQLIAKAGLPTTITAEELLDREAAGDKGAGAILTAWVTPLRSAIDTTVAAFDPDLVLLGGGLGTAAYRALARAPALAEWYKCPVAAAELGDDAGVIGSGICALIEHIESKSVLRRGSRRIINRPIEGTA